MFIMFPGQGSQTVGMGKAFADAFVEAREVFEEVDEALQEKLSQIIFEGPLEDLSRTQNTQPALMAVSMAMVRVLEGHFGFKLADKATYLAGHSLGELTALTAAGVMPLAETARLLRLRGTVMQQAVPEGKGAMAAILGLSLEDVEAVTKQVQADNPDGVCSVANDNCPGQVVISGHRPLIEAAIEQAKAAGAKRGVLLNVSAPFHCSLMAPARDAMAQALKDVDFQTPYVPIVSNVTATPSKDPVLLQDCLIRQVDGRVRWRETLLAVEQAGLTQGVEIGAGTVLGGLMRKTCPSIAMVPCGTPEEMEAFVNNQ